MATVSRRKMRPGETVFGGGSGILIPFSPGSSTNSKPPSDPSPEEYPDIAASVWKEFGSESSKPTEYPDMAVEAFKNLGSGRNKTTPSPSSGSTTEPKPPSTPIPMKQYTEAEIQAELKKMKDEGYGTTEISFADAAMRGLEGKPEGNA